MIRFRNLEPASNPKFHVSWMGELSQQPKWAGPWDRGTLRSVSWERFAQSRDVGQVGLAIGLFQASTAPNNPVSGEAHLRQRLFFWLEVDDAVVRC
jgi:hypothetical protein